MPTHVALSAIIGALVLLGSGCPGTTEADLQREYAAVLNERLASVAATAKACEVEQERMEKEDWSKLTDEERQWRTDRILEKADKGFPWEGESPKTWSLGEAARIEPPPPGNSVIWQAIREDLAKDQCPMDLANTLMGVFVATNLEYGYPVPDKSQQMVLVEKVFVHVR